MVIQYNEMAGFIISAYKPLYTSLFNEHLVFTFENYVKCQMHMPALSIDLFDRDIYTYFDVYEFLQGNNRKLDSCVEVLDYFYKDLHKMIVEILKRKPELPYRIDAVTELPYATELAVKTYSLEEEREKIQAALNLETNEEILLDFSESEIKQLVASDMLCMASILRKHRKNGMAILEVV